jgi:hypothetical protein
MITLVDLTQQIAQADQNIIDAHKSIKAIIDIKPLNADQYKANNKELKRLKATVKKQTESRALFNLVKNYISSGVQMEGIKEQRNILLVKISSIKEREKIEGINRELTDKENKKVIAAFETKYKVKKLRQQLRVMNFILK